MRTSKRDWSGKRDSNLRPQPWRKRGPCLPNRTAAVMVLRNWIRVLWGEIESKVEEDWSGKRDFESCDPDLGKGRALTN